MAEPIRNPNFPPVGPERELPAADLSPTEQLIVTEAQPSNPRLTQTAEAVGSAVGSAVRRVDEVRERFKVIRGKAEETAAARSEELKRAAEEWKHLANERPLQIIGGAAVAGFAIGIALRTWRSSRG